MRASSMLKCTWVCAGAACLLLATQALDAGLAGEEGCRSGVCAVPADDVPADMTSFMQVDSHTEGSRLARLLQENAALKRENMDLKAKLAAGREPSPKRAAPSEDDGEYEQAIVPLYQTPSGANETSATHLAAISSERASREREGDGVKIVGLCDGFFGGICGAALPEGATLRTVRNSFMDCCVSKGDHDAHICRGVFRRLIVKADFRSDEDSLDRAFEPTLEVCLSLEESVAVHAAMRKKARYGAEKVKSMLGLKSLHNYKEGGCCQADGGWCLSNDNCLSDNCQLGECQPQCFPADATVMTQDGAGQILRKRLEELQPGELVAVRGATGHIAYEPVLADMHSQAEHAQLDVPYLMLLHEHGSLNVTAGHFVFSKERGPVPAADLQVGEHLLVDAGRGRLEASALLGPPEALRKRGAYAPLTYSGTVIVDGVLASSYSFDHVLTYVASASVARRFVQLLGGYGGVHRMIHALTLPLRAAHALGLPEALSALASLGVPGAALLLRGVVPDDRNKEVLSGTSSLPLYAQVVGQMVGSALQTVL